MTVTATAIPPRRRARRTGVPGTPCPDCNKFCSLEEPEVESAEVSVDGDSAQITAEIVRNSSCCSAEIKRASLEGEVAIDHECPNADIIGREVCLDGAVGAIEDGFGDAENDAFEGYTSGGGRYQAMKVGVSGSFTVVCKACGEEVEVDVPEGLLEIEAGQMEVGV